MPGTEVFLFVYGTLKRSDDGEVHPLLKQGAEFSGAGRVKGKLYQKENYPGLIAEGSAEVTGELYRVTDPEGLFERLDFYEGCGPGDEAEFLRAEKQAETEIGRTVTAWMYLLSHKPEEKFLIPEGVYRA